MVPGDETLIYPSSPPEDVAGFIRTHSFTQLHRPRQHILSMPWGLSLVSS